MKKIKKSTKSQPELERILIIPDVHHPFEDKKAWALMLKAAKQFKPETTVLLGDFCDMFDVSSHSKDPSRRFKLDEEMTYCKARLDEVIALKSTTNVFIAGNHEDRLTRYLQDSAPELHKFISIPKILELKEKGFKYIDYKQSYKIGKLFLTHDVGSSGPGAVKAALASMQRNIGIGHIHRCEMVISGNLSGEHHIAFSPGWLGDADEINYMHRDKVKKDWCLGFSVAYRDKKTNVVYVTLVPIINYTCLIEGKLITLDSE